MNLKSTIATAVLAFTSVSSQAGVVYEWVEVENNMPIGPVYMRIEIAEQVVRSGSFTLAVDPGESSIPKTGLISFWYRHMYAAPGSWIPADVGYLYMDLQFVHNNFFMTGSIRGQDWMVRMHASSGTFENPDPLLWRINNTDHDPGTPCYLEPNGFCEGATGYFRQVPEPASAALFGLGMVGVVAARRRKRKLESDAHLALV